jgi:hypothetical protein
MPDRSLVGIVLLAASVVIMPWLARAKRRAGEALGSRLVIADAAETAVRVAVGLDPRRPARLHRVRLDLGGRRRRLLIAGFAVMEGKEAWEGEIGCDDDD